MSQEKVVIEARGELHRANVEGIPLLPGIKGLADKAPPAELGRGYAEESAEKGGKQFVPFPRLKGEIAYGEGHWISGVGLQQTPLQQLLNDDDDIEGIGGLGDMDFCPHLRGFVLVGSTVKHGGEENYNRILLTS
jgi:hypothetical protein